MSLIDVLIQIFVILKQLIVETIGILIVPVNNLVVSTIDYGIYL